MPIIITCQQSSHANNHQISSIKSMTRVKNEQDVVAQKRKEFQYLLKSSNQKIASLHDTIARKDEEIKAIKEGKHSELISSQEKNQEKNRLEQLHGQLLEKIQEMNRAGEEKEAENFERERTIKELEREKLQLLDQSNSFSLQLSAFQEQKAQSAQEIEKLTQQLLSMESTTLQLNSTSAHLQSQKASLLDQVASLNDQNQELRRKLANFQEQVSRHERKAQEISLKHDQVEKAYEKISQDCLSLANQNQELRKQQHEPQPENKKEEGLDILNTNVLMRKFCQFCPGSEILTFQHRRHLFDNFYSMANGHSTVSFTASRLLYRFDPKNKVNFHQYFDEKPYLLVLCKSVHNRLIGAFSVAPFKKYHKEIDSRAELFYASLPEPEEKRILEEEEKRPSEEERDFKEEEAKESEVVFKHYEVSKPEKAIEYNDFMLIFGSSDFRLNNGELKLFSNLGVANSFYGKKSGDKSSQYLGVQNHVVELLTYEIYQLFYSN